MIVVTLFAVPLGFISLQLRIVRERKVVFLSNLGHIYGYEPMDEVKTYSVNVLRSWLADFTVEQFCFYDDATDNEIEIVHRAFPEAAIWRGEHSPRLIEKGDAWSAHEAPISPTDPDEFRATHPCHPPHSSHGSPGLTTLHTGFTHYPHDESLISLVSRPR